MVKYSLHNVNNKNSKFKFVLVKEYPAKTGRCSLFDYKYLNHNEIRNSLAETWELLKDKGR